MVASRNFRLTAIFSLLFVLFAHSQLLAADIFNLSYALTEGGYQLELSPNNLYRGVSIRVDTNIAKRYEVIQKVIQPLVNRDNPGVTIQDNFLVRAISGSNRTGNLRFSTGDTPVRTEDIIYTSSPTGDADSFSLVYGLANVSNLEPGYYAGRISFTLNPIGASQQQVTKILEVYVSITNQGPLKPRVEISTQAGSKYIILNPKKEKNQLSCDVLVKINSVMKSQFSIVQFLAEPIESDEGNSLEKERVNFAVRNTSKGTSLNRVTPLANGPQIIYTSGIDGTCDNYFTVNFTLGDLSKEKAGKYRSRIQYFLDEQGVQTKIDTLELEIDNESLFDLTVTPQDQKYEIEFRDLKPQAPPKTSEVVLEVKSNTGKPYQISQEMSSGLVNKEGVEIPAKYFTLRTENINAKGNLKFLEKQEVKKGNTILFVSDSSGTPVKIKVIYELTSPMEIKAGDYSANVTYSLLEM
jgi:hypothetical protein